MSNDTYTRLRTAALTLGAVLVAAGCQENRATVFSPIGPPSYDFTVSPAAAGLPSGNAATAGNSVVLQMSNLRNLTSGVYQFWGVTADSTGRTVATKAYGRVVEQFQRDSTVNGKVQTDPVTGDTLRVPDSTVVANDGAATYKGTSKSGVTVVVTLDSLGSGNAPSAENSVVLSLETAQASQPSNDQFLWERIGLGGGAMSFGNYGGPDAINQVSPNDYIYLAVGTGEGGVRGSEFSVDLTDIARPPMGFYYRGFLVDGNGAGTLVDTLRTGYSAVAAQNRVNLINVDQSTLYPGVFGTEISSSQIRNCASGSGVAGCQNTLKATGADTLFKSFKTFVVALDPKAGGAAMGPGVAMSGTIPGIVQK